MVCVDFDGTITDLDTFDHLVVTCASEDAWRYYECQLTRGTMSVRDALDAQARLIRGTVDDVDRLLVQSVRFDPTFASFVRRCRSRDIALVVLSSGIGELIRRAMVRNDLAEVEVRANEADPSPQGWTMRFADESDNGHDKAAAVRAFQRDGARVVFVGDGISDFDAALAADVRFARAGRSLERFLKKKNVGFTSFSSFAQIERALFA